MHLHFLGGASEVGRSAMTVSDGKTNLCIDYGVKTGKEPEWPLMPEGKVDAIFVTHSHLDHVGSIPILYKNASPPLYANDVTLETTKLLLEDSFKVASREGYKLPFAKADYKSAVRATRVYSNNQVIKIGDFTLTFFNAGHIPGSVMILVRDKRGKTLLNTGNFKFDPSRLLVGAKPPKEKVNTVILESTYGDKNQPVRDLEEKRLINIVEEAIRRKEPVLIPCFAVGRAQEVLLMLSQYADKIALDGMAKTAAAIVSRHERYLRHPEALRDVLRKITWVKDDRQRAKAARKFPVIVTTAGMLGGGPVHYYLRQMKEKHRAQIVFVGYLAEETPARTLVETGVFKTAQEEFNVECEIHKLTLSAHADRKEALRMVEQTQPDEVFCVHGEEGASKSLAKEVERRFGCRAVVPKNGERLDVW